MKNLFYFFSVSFLKYQLANKLFAFLTLLSLSLPQQSCNTIDPTDDIKPGRRDYVWTVDTLVGLNSPRFRMWGSSPSDV